VPLHIHVLDVLCKLKEADLHRAIQMNVCDFKQ